jgi:site-specific recombinase XerD
MPEGEAEVVPPSELRLDAFCSYLLEVRGLSARTIAGHRNRLQSFLAFLGYDESPMIVATLDLNRIEAYLCEASKTNNRASLQHVVASIRSFLQREHAQGSLRQPLHERIDTPRTYRLEQLPRAVPWEKVAELLRSIDQSNPEGLRDFTILYLAARYGLRSGELVALKLDDIDWRSGTLRIPQSKTKQSLLLPLDDEIVDVLVGYLQRGRPAAGHREIFLRIRAPMSPLSHYAVHDILEKRVRLGRLDIPYTGTHFLRHSLAMHLLHRGTSMDSIGSVLGHRDPESTAVYLRLAVEDLREVGLPVPENGEAAALHPDGWKGDLPKIRTAHPVERPPVAGFRSPLADLLRTYLAVRRALGRRYSGEEVILRGWDDFLHLHGANLQTIGSDMFHRWAGTMPHLTPTVLRNRLRIVRNFLIYCARTHPDLHVPDVATFPNPHPARPPRLVSGADMSRVLATVEQLLPSHQNPVRGPTVRMALILLYCCGLRRGELLRLKLRHFDPQQNVLRVEATKFYKSRLIPLPDSVVRELCHYLQLRRHHLPDQPECALIWSGNHMAPEKSYSAPGLISNWQQLCLAAGVVDERGRPPRLHDLRHSFAVAALQRWYEASGDVQARLPHLSTYMGHACPCSTHYYLHLTPGLREAASLRFHQYAGAISERGADR